MTHVDPDLFLSTACCAGVSDRLAADALAAVLSREQILLGVSGGIASGKDTVAAETLAHFGRPDAVRMSFAAALRADIDAMIDALADEPDPCAALRRFDVPESQVAELAGILTAQLAEDPSATSRSRTPLMRTALQFYGTDVRRASNPDHWVHRAVAATVELLAARRDVVFTDLRFPNEVEALSALGFCTVRLRVSPEVQRARLLARDGPGANLAALEHSSEHRVDGTVEFGLVVDNDGPLSDTVAVISDWLGSAVAPVSS